MTETQDVFHGRYNAFIFNLAYTRNVLPWLKQWMSCHIRSMEHIAMQLTNVTVLICQIWITPITNVTVLFDKPASLPLQM